MVNKKTSNFFSIFAFSLLELMVVIAIMGAVLAGAVPLYREYIVKTKIATAVPALKSLGDDIRSQMEQGITDYPILIKGANATSSGSYYEYQLDPVVMYRVWTNSSLPSEIGVGEVLVCAYMSGLNGIDSHVSATLSSSGAKSRICLLMYEEDDLYKNYCGSWNTANNEDIPIEYLPSGCNCANIIVRSCI